MSRLMWERTRTPAKVEHQEGKEGKADELEGDSGEEDLGARVIGLLVARGGQASACGFCFALRRVGEKRQREGKAGRVGEDMGDGFEEFVSSHFSRLKAVSYGQRALSSERKKRKK